MYDKLVMVQPQNLPENKQNLQQVFNESRSGAPRKHQNCFWPVLCPGPAGGAHDAPPDPLVSWEGIPLPILHPIRHLYSRACSV